MSLRRLSLAAALFAVFVAVALNLGSVTYLIATTPGRTPAALDARAGHAALRPFDLAGKALPDNLFLVRTRGELPAGAMAAGVVVLGERNGVFLVSGAPDAVMALAGTGCAVFPIEGVPAATRSAPQQRAPLDTPDPAIAAMVAEVEWAGVSDKIQWLVDFGTRYSYAANHQAVAESIGGLFAGYGLAPVLRSFVYNSRTLWNVEATQIGTVYPDSFYIICGHFDSTSEAPTTNAPGADDNGSGAAAVLTAAEILTAHDFEYSIRYICFAGEEQGLRGSQNYAAWAASTGLAIAGVLNFDMAGWWQSGAPKDLEIETNVASQWLAAIIVNCADLYTTAPYVLHVYDGAWWGDHASFWNQGYAAVNHEEAWDWGDPDFNPYYHSSNDLLAYLDPDFTVDNIQVGVAALATLAVPIPEPTAVDGRAPALAGVSLTAYPNPFGGQVAFTVAGLAGRERARIVVYDVRGRRVDAMSVALHDGRGMAIWMPRDIAGGAMRSGVYFAELEGFPGASPVKIVHVN
jgi:hypothetical protein